MGPCIINKCFRKIKAYPINQIFFIKLNGDFGSRDLCTLQKNTFFQVRLNYGNGWETNCICSMETLLDPDYGVQLWRSKGHSVKSSDSIFKQTKNIFHTAYKWPGAFCHRNSINEVRMWWEVWMYFELASHELLFNSCPLV